MKRSLTGIAMLIVLSSISTALATDPPYLYLKAGETAEIRGRSTKDGLFLADEIEILPVPRRPKLRGVITDIDTSSQQIFMFGQWITIAPTTQFVGVIDEPVGISLLKTNTRVEVSCKLDSADNWIARHIRFRDVKGSDQIKGTVTRVSFEGRATDTLLISGLPVGVRPETKVYRTLGTPEDTVGGNDAGDDDE